MIIPVKVRNKIASIDPELFIVSDNSDYVLQFDFDDEWAGSEVKTVKVSYGGYSALLIMDGAEITLPAITTNTILEIGVFTDNVRTTTAATIPVISSVLQGGGGPAPEPSPDVYNQLIAKLNELVAGVQAKHGYPVDRLRHRAYLHEVWYNTLDYCRAKEYYMSSKAEGPVGGCSATRLGNFVGRQFDWNFDNKAEFIVHTPHIGSRYASFGICGNMPDLTEDFVNSDLYSEQYRILPFNMLDGLNEAGLFCEVNVVPDDYGQNRIEPPAEYADDVCASMMVRYILDHYASVDEACAGIQTIGIYFPQYLRGMHCEVHWLVADATKSKVIEIVNGAVSIQDAGTITNFHLYDVEFEDDGTVCTPKDGDTPTERNQIEPHGQGLERFNTLIAYAEQAGSFDTLLQALQDVHYTKAYTLTDPEEVWYTEFCGDDLTVDSTPEEFADILALARRAYADRSRDTAYTWHSAHSVVYDLVNKVARVRVQEDDTNTYCISMEDPATLL